jgi:hypothetical protein
MIRLGLFLITLEYCDHWCAWQHVQGPFGDFQGNCDKLEGLEVDKSRFSRPCVASVDGPMNYWGQRNTFSSTNMENDLYFLVSDVFYFYRTSYASRVRLGNIKDYRKIIAKIIGGSQTIDNLYWQSVQLEISEILTIIFLSNIAQP